MKPARMLGAIASGLALFVVGFAGLTVSKAKQRFVGTPYPDIEASSDSAVIERGRYLVYGPAACSNCHVPTEQSRTLARGEYPALVGGLELEMPGFGIVRSPNLTPDDETGIGGWTDREIARMVRYGVDRNGDASLEMSFVGGNTSDEDLTAIVSYLRASPAVKVERPRSEHSFAYSVIVAWLFDPLEPLPNPLATSPSPGATVERGEYLANGPANCVGCHSAVNPLDLSLSRKFGGAEATPDMFDPSREFAAPNITSHPRGRLSAWSEQDFVNRFRAGKLIPTSGMPWAPLSNMTDDDLRAIYRYLKSVPPVDYDPGPSHREAGWKPRSG